MAERVRSSVNSEAVLIGNLKLFDESSCAPFEKRRGAAFCSCFGLNDLLALAVSGFVTLWMAIAAGHGDVSTRNCEWLANPKEEIGCKSPGLCFTSFRYSVGPAKLFPPSAAQISICACCTPCSHFPLRE